MSAALSAALIVTIAGGVPTQHRPSLDAPDLELLQFVVWAEAYAHYQYACEKLSPNKLERKTRAALGSDYSARIGNIQIKLSRKYDKGAVELASIYVTPAYVMGPQVCARFAHVVPDALESLRELERRTEDSQ